jgi:hypothetical protein
MIAIAASNGEDLSALCEVTNTDCMIPVKFKIIPRTIKTAIINVSDNSSIAYRRPTAEIQVLSSNVDFKFDDNNKLVTKINHKTQIPFSHKLKFLYINFNPNTVKKSKPKVFVTNIDMYPLPYYMSNAKYVFDDVVTINLAFNRPDIHIKSKKKDIRVFNKITGVSVPVKISSKKTKK